MEGWEPKRERTRKKMERDREESAEGACMGQLKEHQIQHQQSKRITPLLSKKYPKEML